LTESGYAVLAFDYRGFGESEGERGRLVPAEQMTDIRNAVTYMQTLGEVDPERIGLWGTSFGGANAIIEAQLQALETANQGKIISSPKVTTMDNVKATIKQGQEIPYVTIDKDGNRSITFKEAVLRLDVKPKITPDGTISMEIKATNDAADYNTGLQLGGNPPINKNEVESKIVVQDGDTIVIGGILKTEDQTGSEGVPWLKHIPILGWLFKTDTINKKRRQLMVFITPKIIKEGTVEDKSEKPNG